MPVSIEVTRASTLINTSTLCGLSPFCNNAVMASCSNIILAGCEDCSMTGASIFMTLVILLGLLIAMGNGFVIRLHLAKRKGFSGNYNRIKASLAIADLLAGIQIFFVTIYNVSWSLNSTLDELDKRQLQLRGSPGAISGGIFTQLVLVSSFYHLLYLCYNRLGAIKRPMVYRTQESRSVHVGLTIVWSVSLLVSILPSFFPCTFTFTYSRIAFVFQLTLANWSEPDLTPFVAYITIVFVMPFLLMTGLSVLSVVALHRNFIKSKDLRGKSRIKNSKDRTAFKMLAIMQVGFTITLIPLLIVVFLTYSHVLNCDNFSKPYLFCAYLCISNSFVNVVVYSFMDKNFRAALVQDFFGRCKRTKMQSRNPQTKYRLIEFYKQRRMVPLQQVPLNQ